MIHLVRWPNEITQEALLLYNSIQPKNSYKKRKENQISYFMKGWKMKNPKRMVLNSDHSYLQVILLLKFCYLISQQHVINKNIIYEAKWITSLIML